MSDLGSRLRQYRKRSNLSLYEVEKQTGLHFSTVGRYERNERVPSLDRLRELATLYETSLGELLTEPEELLAQLPQEIRESTRLLLEREPCNRLLTLAARFDDQQLQRLIALLESVAPHDS